jgi:hypothetical protein
MIIGQPTTLMISQCKIILKNDTWTTSIVDLKSDHWTIDNWSTDDDDILTKMTTAGQPTTLMTGQEMTPTF